MASTVFAHGRRLISALLFVVPPAANAQTQGSAQAPAAGRDTLSASHLGIDVAVYPGDSALSAWKYPASPYRWIGYYLAAPCRRDSSWVGKRAALTNKGWGVAAIYVGQQDWGHHPSGAAPQKPAADSLSAKRAVPPAVPPVSAANPTAAANATPQPSQQRPQVQHTGACSGQFLTAERGTSEAADAVAKLRSEGFPDRSVLYLDVELVTEVTPALLAYYTAWIDGVLRDGRYLPGVYAAKANAQALYDAALARFRAAGRSDAPPFWISSVAGFAPTLKPADVGFDFARIWQGQVGVPQSFGGVPLTVDVNVSTSPNPSGGVR